MKIVDVFSKLHGSQRVFVDDEDYDSISKMNWHVSKQRNSLYAFTRLLGKKTSMHRIIMQPSIGMFIDHINHNGLDNRRCNLRVCTNSENIRNSRSTIGSRSKYLGVSIRKNKIHSYITYNRKQIYLGVFEDEVSAAKAYDIKAKELFGEFANLNFK